MISNFKLRRLLMFFALFACMFNSTIVTAQTRYTSAEMYADYIGSGPGNFKYRVTLIVYAACLSGSPAPTFNSTEKVCWESSHYTIKESRNLPLIKPADTLDNMYCSSATNSCRDASSTNLGFGRAIYSDTITVASVADDDWEFDWVGIPRDQPNNLYIPAVKTNFNVNVRCRINNLDRYNVSTPRYLAMPKFIACYNEHNEVPVSPYDPNGDSLFTHTVTPHGSGTNCFNQTSLSFDVGYSVVLPIDAAASDPFTVNPYSGLTTFTPTVNGDKYNLTYQTDKYDIYSGKYLGYCQRDMEMFVQSCAATPPRLDTIPIDMAGGTYDTANHVLYVCPNQLVRFTLNANGASGSALTFTSDNATTAAGSNFYANYLSPTVRADSMIGTFSWTASANDIGLHTIDFIVRDTACTSGAQIPVADFTITIRVQPSVDAGPDLANCFGVSNSLPAQLNVTGVPPGSNFYWYDAATGVGANDSLSDSTIQNPTANPTVTTDYVVVVTDANKNPLACKTMDTVRVHVYSGEVINGGPDQTICLNQSTKLAPKLNAGDTAAWSPDPTLSNDSVSKPWAKPTIYGTTTYFLHVRDVNGCIYFDSTHVITSGIAPKLFSSILPDTVCPGGTAQLSTTVQEQACGAASPGSCKGTAADVVVDGPSKKPTCGTPGTYQLGDPTPYAYYQYGNGGRMQILYTKDELNQAGIQAGYINNVSFNVCSKNVPPGDSLVNFKIGLLCSSDDHFDYNASYGTYVFKPYVFTTVYTAKAVEAHKGVNTYQFSTPYYWDGSTNLIMQICYASKYGDPNWNFANTPTGDMVTIVSTPGVQCVEAWENASSYTTGVLYDGCSYVGPWDIYGSSSRPATTFNICNSTAAYTYSWTPGTYLNNTTSNAPVASKIYTNQTYIVKVAASSNPGCASSDTLRVAVDTSTEISVVNKDIILCRPGYTQPSDIDADARGNRPISNMACGTANPQNCSSPSVVSLGKGAQTSYNGPFYYGSNKTQWIIPRDMLLKSGMTSGTIRSMDINNIWGVYSYTAPIFKNVEVRIGCTAKDSYTSPSDTLSVRNMVLVYTAATLDLSTVTSLNIPFATPYNWDTTQNLVVQICYGSTNGNYTYAYTATVHTNANRMIAYYGYGGDFCGTTAGSYSPAGFYKSIPAVSFHYCVAPDGNFAYTWKPGDFLSDSTIKNPTAYVPKSIDYSVSTMGRNGCIISDTMHIYVPVHHFSVYPKDTAVCAGQKVTFHARGGTIYQWYQNGFKKASTLSCDNCADPVSSALDTTTYQVVVGDSVFCYDTLSSVKIDVKPIPVVKIVNNDTTIDYGSSVQLYAQGANVFTWSPTATLSNPNIVNPVASPTEPVTYTVTGIAADGCAAQDTVHVNINYRGKLFVPSAFSPNGDGKNDRFKVSNLTFEKVLEFRVYNRWGQQVFEGNDNSGWDGKWKNVPQDMGAYEYLVRVGFPDGFVETFKGSVTLVR